MKWNEVQDRRCGHFLAPGQSSQTRQPQSSPMEFPHSTTRLPTSPLRACRPSCMLRVAHDSFARRLRSLPSLLRCFSFLSHPLVPSNRILAVTFITRAGLGDRRRVDGRYVPLDSTPHQGVRAGEIADCERSSRPPLRFALACSTAGQFGGLPFEILGCCQSCLSISLRRHGAVMLWLSRVARASLGVAGTWGRRRRARW